MNHCDRARRIAGLCSSILAAVALAAALNIVMAKPADAATLCVNHKGTGGCYSSISGAVAAASAGDTVNVAPGTYTEDVVIGKSIALLGAGAEATKIDASGLANGVYIDGIDHAGLKAVIVSGFTIANAKFEGLLATNASDVTIRDNELTGNDKGIVLPGGSSSETSCPGIPAFETGESFDCGEAVHLSGIDHSVIEGNTVSGNAGGILVSDDTGPTFDNLISHNVVRRNPLDCGITVASHPASTGAPASFGVYRNTIAANVSQENGLVSDAGAGVGLFAAGPGNAVYANVVIGNRLIGNALPGVAMHNHFSLATFPANLNDNMIVGNYIAGNGADTADALTPGSTGINVFGFGPISGTVIAQNVIRDEADDVVTNTAAAVTVHLNELLGSDAVGVNNIGTGTVDATENWWGCARGPSHNGCSSAQGSGVAFTPWLTSPPAHQPDDRDH